MNIVINMFPHKKSLVYIMQASLVKLWFEPMRGLVSGHAQIASNSQTELYEYNS